uniref:Crinkler effector protein N-terminal domain-containing protein n=1 Tax=Peronospora matthiolae TaxID=2874970 RepID=A0AAV1TNA3_9STRA
MVQITLFCAIVGARESVFPVDIDTDEIVGHLKTEIRDKSAVLKQHAVIDLHLFLAKRDGAWLPDNSDLDDVVQTKGCLDYMERMRVSHPLGDPNLFGPGVSLGEGVVHVLVVLPSVLRKPPSKPVAVLLKYCGVTLEVIEKMLNPPLLVDFWNALRTDTTEIAENAMIALPEGTFILGKPSLGSRIYIRHCYPRLWHVCWHALHRAEDEKSRLVILGNPGIGKTYFGYLVLLYLAHRRATVVYENATKRFLFCGEVVAIGSRTDFDRVLDQSEAFYVVDGVEPSSCEAKTILITSPRRDVWCHFSDGNCATLFMPVWTKEEIFTCRELMYPHTPVTVVEECYRRWGGIARYVLRHAEDPQQQGLLSEAIARVQLKAILGASVESCGDEGVLSHALIHFRVDCEFSKECFAFASKYVTDGVYATLYKRNKKELMKFLGTSHRLRNHAAYREALFETHVHIELSQGGNFRARRLTEGPKGYAGGGNQNESKVDFKAWDIVKLRPRSSLLFRRVSQVAHADPSIYLQPASSNITSVDAMAKPNELFQVTCASMYPCERKGLREVLHLLGDPATPRLYFVVPPNVFNGFDSNQCAIWRNKMEKVCQNVEVQRYVLEVRCARKKK